MMSILKDVFVELFSMFVGDARLTISILILVGIVAALASGGVLLIGCLAILIESVLREARVRRRR
ncbi:MAG: hypothetical protein NWR87_08225 [Rhodospirillales bacterium]|nr:hypothetical protein [Rhodospirillales bacterium]